MKSTPDTRQTEAELEATPSQRAVFTKEFKLAAVARLKAKNQTAQAIASELGIRRNQLYKWGKEVDQHGPDGSFKPRGRPPAVQESEIAKLRRQLAKAQQELDILKKFDAYLKRQKR